MSRSDLHAPPAPDAGVLVAHVAWPEEADRRWALAQDGVPRLLFIAPGHPVPAPLDLHEDWVRLPVADEEVSLRTAHLVRRAQDRDRPVTTP